MLHIRVHIIISILITAFFAGCSAGKSKEDDHGLHAAAAARYGYDFDLIPNSAGDFMLCVKKEKPRAGIQPLSFFVYSTQDDSVVYERDVENGTVEWLDESRLLIHLIPGNVSGDEKPDAFREIYDLITRTLSR